MIKRNKKITKLFIAAMCTSLTGNLGVSSSIKAFADEISESNKVNSEDNSEAALNDGAYLEENSEDSTLSENEQKNTAAELTDLEEETESDIEETGSIMLMNSSSECGTNWDTSTYPYTATIDNIIYERDRVDNDVVWIKGFVNGGAISGTIPDSIAVLSERLSVKGIKDEAFESCRTITDISISGHFDTIGKFAFAGSTITNVNINEGVQSIENYAFASCTSLKEITIPNSITSFGQNIFDGCNDDLIINVKSEKTKESLINLGINENKIHLDSNIFDSNDEFTKEGITYKKSSGNNLAVTKVQNKEGEVEIPSTISNENTNYNITSIADNAFKGCSNIEKVNLPDSVTKIGNSAFEGCSNLKDVNLSKVKSLGEAAFKNCSNLQEVELSERLDKINDYTFYGCTALDSIELKNVSSIENSALEGCSNLVSVYTSCKSINKNAFKDCSNLSNVNIKSDDFEYIGEDTFDNCSESLKFIVNSESARNTLINYGIDENKIFNDTDFIIWDSNNQCTIDEIVYEKTSENTACAVKETKEHFTTDIKNTIEVNGEEYDVTDVSSNGFASKMSYCLNKLLIIPDKMTTIKSGSFPGCYCLNKIVLPDTIERIEEDAFDKCDELKYVLIPDNVEYVSPNAFSRSSDLTLLVNSYDVKEKLIGFGFDENLIKVINANQSTAVWDNNGECVIGNIEYKKVDDSSVSITGSYLSGSSLDISSTITVGGTEYSVVSIGDYAFEGDTTLEKVNVPDSVKSIGKFAFSKCENLQDVSLPAEINALGNEVFSNCTNLINANIPSNISELPEKLFYNCENLDTIEIPSGVTKINYYDFCGCKSLKDVTIPDTVTEIGAGAFCECRQFTKLVIPDTVETIGSTAFCGCSNVEDIIIPENVKKINSYTFDGCSALKSITLPDNISFIGDYAFNYCKSLETINLPKALITMGSYMLRGCDSLTEIIVPENVVNINTYCFDNCSSLEKVDILSKNASLNGYDIFDRDNCPDILVATAQQFTQLTRYNINPNKITVKNAYTLYLDLNGGTGTSRLNRLTSGEPVTLPADPSRGKDEFAGWYKDKELTQEFKNGDILNETTTLYAKWNQYNSNAADWCISESEVGSDSKFVIDGVKFLKYDDNTIGIIGYDNIQGNINIPENITIGDSQYPVVFICSEAFKDCTDLTGIVLPDTISKISYDTFKNCKNLRTISFPRNLTELGQKAFSNCNHLVSAILPDSVTEMDSSVFSACYELKDVHIPAGLTTIPYAAFSECHGITSIELPDSIKNIESFAFDGCSFESIKLPEGLKSLGICTFANCEDLKELKIPDDIKVIPNSLCDYCLSLEKVSFADDITSIDEEAFSNCGNLKSINIPDTVTSIGERAFYLSGLENIELSDGISVIPQQAFAYCSNLKHVKLPAQLQTIATQAFIKCSSLETIDFPESLKVINGKAFESCTSLDKAMLPDGLTTLDDRAFCLCENIREAKVPDSITRLYDKTFASCGNLKNLIMSANITELPPYLMVTESSPEANIWTNNEDTLYCTNADRYNIILGMPLTIDFNLNGGNGTDKLNYVEGNTPIYNMPEAPVKDGFIFTGWYKDPELTDKFNQYEGISEDATLYAGWKEEDKSLKWDDNNQCVADNIQYTFNHDDYVTVSGIENAAEEVTIPSQITVNGKDYLVTSIGDCAFKDCASLKNVSMGQNMYYLGYEAFAGCLSLENILIPQTVTAINPFAFTNCSISNIKFVLEDEGTKDVLSTAGINSTNIEVAQKAASDSEYVIEGIKYAINHDNYATVTGSVDTESEDIVIPDTVTINGENYLVTSIGDCAFKNCRTVKNVSIGNNVCYLGYCAFMNCSSLENIAIPKAVTAIGDSAFEGCNMDSLNVQIEDESTKEILNNAGMQNINIEIK